MARFEVTIRDPDAARADLTLAYTAHDGGYQRGYVPAEALDGFSQLGSAIKNGPAYGDRYIWTMAIDLTEGQYLALNSFILLQQQRDFLWLDDEHDYLPAAAYGSRTQIAGTATTIDGEACALFSFKVFIELAQFPLVHRGQDSAGNDWKRYTISVSELPEVIL